MTPAEFEGILPLAAAWAEKQESRILSAGVALDTVQLADARKMGVTYPEKVRLLAVSTIPSPDDPILVRAAQDIRLISPFTAGLTLRYGIYIRCELICDRALISHELVHTAQYERLGGIEAFLRQYLFECLTIGYPAAPMEQEAVVTSALIRQTRY